jgi:hypothetical protein
VTTEERKKRMYEAVKRWRARNPERCRQLRRESDRRLYGTIKFPLGKPRDCYLSSVGETRHTEAGRSKGATMHSCPECGQACYCNGDIDDIDSGDGEAEDNCICCTEGEFDDDYNDEPGV